MLFLQYRGHEPGFPAAPSSAAGVNNLNCPMSPAASGAPSSAAGIKAANNMSMSPAPGPPDPLWGNNVQSPNASNSCTPTSAESPDRIPRNPHHPQKSKAAHPRPILISDNPNAPKSRIAANLTHKVHNRISASSPNMPMHPTPTPRHAPTIPL
jgi:hypothetical protein